MNENARGPRALLSAVLALLLALSLAGCSGSTPEADATPGPAPAASAQQEPAPTPEEPAQAPADPESDHGVAEVPAYTGEQWADLSGGEPAFTEGDLARTEPFIELSPLDGLGRTTGVFALVTPDSLPDKERESITGTKPSGWNHPETGHSNNVKSDSVDGGWAYNRCHLLAHCLSGLDSDPENLVTGTRALNLNMRDLVEMDVLEHVRSGGSVLYRATPHFEGDELVCRSVQVEALSTDDGGRAVRVNRVFYNVQPGFSIDHATGEVKEETAKDGAATEGRTFVANERSRVFHDPACDSVGDMKEKNRRVFEDATAEEMEQRGYRPCGSCGPDRP